MQHLPQELVGTTPTPVQGHRQHLDPCVHLCISPWLLSHSGSTTVPVLALVVVRDLYKSSASTLSLNLYETSISCPVPSPCTYIST